MILMLTFLFFFKTESLCAQLVNKVSNRVHRRKEMSRTTHFIFCVIMCDIVPEVDMMLDETRQLLQFLF